ncbi:MAG: hypothetical protein A3J06_02470 [Candidatus Moranbacteria bacterium RIFCSPLOWO2_02_FULL_48_19]|nr:MAG: hypothetical protein A3J06_02470 [Candidatus Moranbacteria bacterium RIFCSPLOWO2_02_FULL_48_19]OGI30189.1 MAG: hypothetical protein A3G09_03150 [Candidatus Moranbacteria bacterium RIFCSPLOWO2_12_FULL_48_12]
MTQKILDLKELSSEDLRLRALVQDLRLSSPTGQFGDYDGWMFEITPWSNDPAVTPAAIKDLADKFFHPVLDQFTIAADGKIIMSVIKPEKLDRADAISNAIQQFFQLLIVPKNLQLR